MGKAARRIYFAGEFQFCVQASGISRDSVSGLIYKLILMCYKKHPRVRTYWFKNLLAEIVHFNFPKHKRTCLAKQDQAGSYMWVKVQSLLSRYENATPHFCWVSCAINKGGFFEIAFVSTHICLALRRLLTFCLSLTR